MSLASDGGGESDREGDESGDEWEDVARDLLAGALRQSADGVHSALHETAESVHLDADVTAEDVVKCRLALNEARRHVEEHLAVVAEDAEPWDRPMPPIPVGRLPPEWRRPPSDRSEGDDE